MDKLCLINIDNNINNTISSINKLDDYIKEEIEDNEPPYDTPPIQENKEQPISINKFKIHTESFDESHIDV